MEEKSPIFVRLESPSSIRKDLLNSAVEAARGLKSYEELKKIRERKVKKIDKLKKLMNTVNREVKTLQNKTLPSLDEVDLLVEGKKIKQSKVNRRLPKTRKKKTVSEEHVDELDKDISDMKLKLAKLGL